MTFGDLANLAAIIGAVAMGVVVSLFYVAYQIRQNTSAVRSATAQAVHENFAAWYQLLAGDSELVQITVDGLRDLRGAFGNAEGAVGRDLHGVPLVFAEAFFKWREGSLSSNLWLGWELLMMNLVSAPGGKAFWKERGYLFGDDFRRHVETVIMTKKPHADAKPMGAFSIGERAG